MVGISKSYYVSKWKKEPSKVSTMYEDSSKYFLWKCSKHVGEKQFLSLIGRKCYKKKMVFYYG